MCKLIKLENLRKEKKITYRFSSNWTPTSNAYTSIQIYNWDWYHWHLLWTGQFFIYPTLPSPPPVNPIIISIQSSQSNQGIQHENPIFSIFFTRIVNPSIFINYPIHDPIHYPIVFFCSMIILEAKHIRTSFEQSLSITCTIQANQSNLGML